MSAREIDGFQFVRTDDLPWRPSRAAAGIFLKDVAFADGWEMQIVRLEPGARFPAHTHAGPEFLLVLEGELVQAGRHLGPGWASVASAGTVDDDVHSETGCLFVLVDQA
jgi:anti-sigma factor ChrR (cupin superfamily)